MYTPYQVALCERIREHCRQRRWYAGDFAPEYRVAHYGPDGKVYLNEDMTYAPAYAAQKDFLHAPATEDEVQETERSLGFALPPVLRAVYTQVANGGFGPGGGILGAPTIARTLTQGSWRLSQREAQHLHQHRDDCLTSEDEPAGLITLCMWDPTYGTYAKLDATSGHVYTVMENVEAPEPTWERAIAIACEASSVEEWLERWLAGDLHPYGDDDADTINELARWESEETDMDEAFEPSREDLAWYEQQFAGNTLPSGG